MKGYKERVASVMEAYAEHEQVAVALMTVKDNCLEDSCHFARTLSAMALVTESAALWACVSPVVSARSNPFLDATAEPERLCQLLRATGEARDSYAAELYLVCLKFARDVHAITTPGEAEGLVYDGANVTDWLYQAGVFDEEDGLANFPRIGDPNRFIDEVVDLALENGVRRRGIRFTHR